MNCLRCRQDNPDAARFCGGCGAKLEAVCPACGAASKSAVEGERKQVTVLFVEPALAQREARFDISAVVREIRASSAER